MRTAKDTDYFITLPEVGEFRFGRETLLDKILIRTHFLGIVKDLKDDDAHYASVFAVMIAEYATLCVSCPVGWEHIGDMELTEQTESQLYALFALWRDQHQSFRNSAASGS
ncbi:MAG: hypothetical protein D4R63_03050 [Methylococcaceae bacterium]|nr:MAG: hypothetical protein D4R63_03050 [Methylococcaceae bacterium]